MTTTKSDTSEERRAPIRIAPRQNADGEAIEPEVGLSLEESAQLLTASSLLPEDPGAVRTTPTPPQRPTAPAKGTQPPAPTAEPEPEPEPPPPTQPEDELEAPEPEPEPEPDPQPEPEPQPDGETVTIPRAEYEELQRSGLRQADYTRKTQALADSQRETATVQAQARKDAALYAQLVTDLQRTLEDATPKEPDWATLRRTLSPDQYARARDEWDTYSKGLAEVRRERTVAEERVAKDRETEVQELKRSELDKLLTLVPEWRNPQKFQNANAQLVEYAMSLGFTAQEINAVKDHRLILLLRDGALGRRGAPTTVPTTRKGPVVRTAPPTAPNTPSPRTPAKEQQAAMSRLRKDKSVEAAGNYFATLKSLD